MATAYGIYDPNFYLDRNKLLSLGFNVKHISELELIANTGCPVTDRFLSQYGYSYEDIRILKYMYAICLGKVSVDTEEELINHLKKLNNKAYKIGIQDLEVSRIQEVPRIAVIDGIKDPRFAVWNSKNYPESKDKIYPVKHVTSQRITIETSKRPNVSQMGKIDVPGVLTLNGITVRGKAEASIDKKYIKLCNRFVIAASIRRPERHHGMYEIICCEGSRVFVYAKTMGVKEKLSYSANVQRIYDFGFFGNQIKPKLNKVAKEVYSKVSGVSVKRVAGTDEYRVMEPQRQDMDLDDDIVE